MARRPPRAGVHGGEPRQPRPRPAAQAPPPPARDRAPRLVGRGEGLHARPDAALLSERSRQGRARARARQGAARPAPRHRGPRRTTADRARAEEPAALAESTRVEPDLPRFDALEDEVRLVPRVARPDRAQLVLRVRLEGVSDAAVRERSAENDVSLLDE